jgi:hypothetical protein
VYFANVESPARATSRKRTAARGQIDLRVFPCSPRLVDVISMVMLETPDPVWPITRRGAFVTERSSFSSSSYSDNNLEIKDGKLWEGNLFARLLMNPGRAERSGGLVNISIRILLRECKLRFKRCEKGQCPNERLPKYTATSRVGGGRRNNAGDGRRLPWVRGRGVEI